MGTQPVTRCTTDENGETRCETVEEPVYGEVPEDASSLEMEAVGRNDTRLTLVFPTRGTVVMRLQNGEAWMESCQGCMAEPGFRRSGFLYLGHPDRRVLRVEGRGRAAYSHPLTVYTGGDVEVRGPVLPLEPHCAQYRALPESAPTTVCASTGALFRLEAGPTGRVRFTGLPATFFGFYAGREVEGDRILTATVVGGLYTATSPRGRFQVYQDPNFASRFSPFTGRGLFLGHAVVEAGEPSPVAP